MGKPMDKGMIRFEIKRLWNKFTIIYIILGFVIQVGLVSLLTELNERAIKENLIFLAEEVDFREEEEKRIYIQISYYNDLLGLPNITEEQAELYLQLIDKGYEEAKFLRDYRFLLNLIINTSDKRRLEIRKECLELMISNYEFLKINSEGKNYELIDLEYELKEVEYLLEHDILPLKSQYDVVFTNYLVLLFSYPFSIFWMFIIIFLSCTVFTRDYESGFYKTIYSNKFSRMNIYFTKWVATVLFIFILILTQLLFSFLLITIKNDFGSWIYPIRVKSDIVAFKNVLDKIIPNILISILFYITFVILTSIIIKKTDETLIIISVLLIIDTSFRQMIPMENNFWNYWIFSSLNSFGSLINGFAVNLFFYLILLIVCNGITILTIQFQDLK